jgi:hypothetical protein
VTDFFDFVTNDKPLQVEIPKIIKAYMRNFYCKLSIDIATADALNVYGIHISPKIVLYRYEERCQKCGYSSTYTAAQNNECWGNHRWNRNYSLLWGADLRNATSEKLAEDFEHFLIHSTDKIVGHKDFAQTYIKKKEQSK